MARRPRPDREAFEDLRCENERRNHQRGKKFANRQRGDKGDGHRKFHRHAAIENVLQRLFENRIAPDQRSHQADHAYPLERLPEMEPDGRSGEGDKDYAKYLEKFETMFVLVLMVVVFLLRALGESISRLGKLNIRFGYFGEFRVCVVLVDNGHIRLRAST